MAELLDQVIQAIGNIILGKEQQIKLALACLIARGHLLIEDLPGVGKTTLTHTIARALGLDFQRIQFTSDMLPADILGVSIFDSAAGRFRFHQGPIFSQVILADEVNRATPKAQSALLEAMEEYQVTIDGETHVLPTPFFVIATQNPTQQIGTFPLPESQLDRFMICLEMGYPAPDAERALLMGQDRRAMLQDAGNILNPELMRVFQEQAVATHASEALIDYLQALLTFSRTTPEFRNGLSPRAGLAMLRCAQAWALMAGRDHVIPEDIQAVLPGVVRHRLQPSGEGQLLSVADRIALMSHVPIP
ncbi:MAG: AAA domain-containing protein [Gammaproteobacteria bacterium]|nr:AAA domain-containing protein [Gammaproteobacteria bacterium]